VPANRRFGRFCATVLLVTAGVIVWGAYVRASKSGDGCGSHWPLCNGQVIPSAKSVQTLIEAAHRFTSGLAFILVAVQFVWALRAFPRGAAVRRTSTAAFALMISEALVGAGLVLFQMVAGNTSIARAAWMALHLLNTFALLAALGLTVWHAHRDPDLARAAPASPPLPASLRPALFVGLAAILLTATSGAIAALGDTLFPARSLAEGLAQDLSPTAHLFLRLRLSHPALAVGTGAYLLSLAGVVASRDASGRVRMFATAAAGLVLLQLALGVMNLVLLAPIPLQLLHLLSADTVWVAFVLLTAAVTAELRAAAPAARLAA
jgi:heme A synthase